MTKKAARAGFDWPDATGILEKIREEATELEIELEGKNQSKVEEEVGDLLFACVNLARFLKIDPEIALKNANKKFVRRFRQMEGAAEQSGRRFQDLSLEEKESLWASAKLDERQPAARKAGRSR